MYGKDLSSRRRTLNGGRWRLTRFCSRWRASASVPVTITSRSATRSAGGPTMLVGADEDAVKQPTLTAAKAKLDLLKLAGFNAVRVTAIWQPGQTQPPTDITDPLSNLTQAAKLDGFRVYVAVYSPGSK